ncbi:MAG: hypothetical protein M0D55_17610 [Elusimicrobiota bacterium]|nr:MAG: hypothetical protein M0D55_17610 [Elusimicrobiota bacterium]
MNRARTLALGVALAFGWHLALRAHGLFLPRLSDEGEYAYAAKVWSEGGFPTATSSTRSPRRRCSSIARSRPSPIRRSHPGRPRSSPPC